MKKILTTLVCFTLSFQLAIGQQNMSSTDSTKTTVKNEKTEATQKTKLVFLSVMGTTAAVIGTTLAFATINITGKSGPKMVKNGAKLFF